MKNPPLAFLRDLVFFLILISLACCLAAAILLVLLVDLFRKDPDARKIRHGSASWYWGKGFVCASRTWPVGAWLRVTYGKAEVVVQVTSRGPFWRLLRRGRLVDLSHTAFVWLENPSRSRIPVSVEACSEPNEG